MSRGTIFQSQSQKIGPWGHVFLTTLPVTTPPALCHEHLPAMTYWFTYTHNVTTLQLHDCQPTSHVDHPPTTSTTVRHGSSLSGRRLSFGLRRRSSAAVLPHQGRASWDEHTATMETGVLQLQVRSCGTAFLLNCDKLTLAFNDLSSY